jgi:hypothetical protein
VIRGAALAPRESVLARLDIEEPGWIRITSRSLAEPSPHELLVQISRRAGLLVLAMRPELAGVSR